uniref:Glycos_transf_1 n=1 Tax=uncultured Pectobacterium sp. TaxID=228954 RepID=A0A060CQD0_9GAMM|nr:Glycos_transf_1 [uncultured Pectobacterium sp.]
MQVDIIGTGPDLPWLKEKVSVLGLEKIFNFHGWSDEPWEMCYNNDALIIPSRFEGVPLVMLEGLCIGIDIIATNADGMRDYIDKSMLFNDQHDLSILLEKHVNYKIAVLNSHIF